MWDPATDEGDEDDKPVVTGIDKDDPPPKEEEDTEEDDEEDPVKGDPKG